MTLITHIWNGNQTIFAGDGRVKENGKIVDDNLQKIFINKLQKCGIGLHGNWPFFDGYSSYLHLYRLVNEKANDISLNKFSKEIKRSFKNAGQIIEAKVILGGFDAKGQSAYSIPLFNKAIDDDVKNEGALGFKTSCGNPEHGADLHKLFRENFKNIFGVLTSDEKKQLDTKKITSFLSEFYLAAYKSKKTNPNGNNGKNIDIYVITPNKVTCLRNDNRIKLEWI